MTDLPDLVATVLDHAAGEEDIEAYGVHRLSTTIQAGTDATMRHVGRAETRGLGIRLIRNGRLGYASTAELDPTAISLTVQRARANADASDIDQAQQLPAPQLADDVDGLLDPSLLHASLADKISLVEDVARRVVSLDPRVTALDTTEYHDEQRTVAIASTRGVQVVHQAGYVELWTDALGEDGDVRASDYSYQFGRTPRGRRSGVSGGQGSGTHGQIDGASLRFAPRHPHRFGLPRGC
ncbi:MAG: DNA gyrase modulator [Nocardioidaceae bacterium]